MRLVNVILLTLLLSVGLAQAEPSSSGVSGFGVMLGYGSATLGTTVDAFKHAAEDGYGGGVFGAFMTYRLTSNVSIQPELLYMFKGAGSNFLGSRSWRHDYLEIPVLVKYCPVQNGNLKPSLFIGPAAALLLSAEFQSSFLNDPIDTKDAMKSTDFSIVLGGELEYRHLSLDIRYDLGLASVYDQNKWNQLVSAEDPNDIFHMTENDSIKNRVLSFALRYRY